jgi:hypothetical protein
VTEEVEELQTSGVSKVRRVRVSAQGEIRIGRVPVGEVRGEVPETTVVRFTDKGDATDELLGRFWCGRNIVYKGEAILRLRKQRRRKRRAD